ncbi:MAG: TonB-dependent receptor, partial [Alphaproteobacteria bacterium]|nr:TonB-dependent receptor [Alphaproteobacteria bacterium]
REKDKSKTHFVSGGVAYNLTDNQTLAFNAKYSQGNGTTSNGITKEQIEENRRQAGNFITDYKETTQDYSLKYDYKISENWEINAKGYYQVIDSNNDSAGIIQISPDSEFGNYGGKYSGTMVGDFKETKLGANLKEKFSYDSGSVISGYEFLSNKLDRNSIVDFPYIFTGPGRPPMQYNLVANNNLGKDTHSIFALLDQKVIGDLSFNAGARQEWAKFNIDRDSNITGSHQAKAADSKSTHDSNQSYSAGLVYDFNPTNKIYVAYERGFVSPSPTQLVDKENNQYVLNNLKSQTGDNYEIGYKGYVLNSFFTLTSFYMQNNNEIVFTDFDMGHTKWHYKNIDRTRRAGAEAFAEQNVWRLTFNESATYLNTRVLRGEYAGQQVATVPDFKAIVNTKYEVIDKLNLGARFNYTGKYLENNVAAGQQETFAPSTFTTDLTMDYSPFNNLYLMTGVNNLFNEKYNISQDSFGNYVVAPERNYYVGFRYEF